MSGRVRAFPGTVGRVIAERCEATRYRTFHVRSMLDIPDVLQTLLAEGFVGSVRINVGPGGVPSNVEVSETQSLDNG